MSLHIPLLSRYEVFFSHAQLFYDFSLKNMPRYLCLFCHYVTLIDPSSLCVMVYASQFCVRRKKLKLAFSLFEEMKHYQIQPNMCFLWSPNYSLNDIISYVNNDHSVKLSYQQTYRAKKVVLELLRGIEEKSYNLLH